MWLDVPRLLSFVRELMSEEEMKVSGGWQGMEKWRGMKRKMTRTGKNFEKNECLTTHVLLQDCYRGVK